MFVFWVPERARVVVISCLECAFCKSNVGFFMLVICSGYCGLVHNAFCEAFSTERARFFFAAIALFRWIFGGFGLLVKDSFVMGCNDLVHVRHAAVAKLQGISVENLV